MNNQQICEWAETNEHAREYAGTTRRAISMIAQGRNQSLTLEVKVALRELQERARRENVPDPRPQLPDSTRQLSI
jgi:P2-related tail formation protein